jgi:CheY-like chemotaxis protein
MILFRMVGMKTIMMIDDDPDEYIICSEVMELLELPLTCKFFTNSTEALQVLQGKMTDFIFIDMVMPKINGVELIEKIKELPKADQSKIIILSTSINEALQKKAIEAGAIACIKKENTIVGMANVMKDFFNKFDL